MRARADANRVAEAAPNRFTPFNLTAFRNSLRLFDDRIGMSRRRRRRVGLLVQFDAPTAECAFPSFCERVGARGLLVFLWGPCFSRKGERRSVGRTRSVGVGCMRGVAGVRVRLRSFAELPQTFCNIAKNG